jgi:hypothetical protein
LSQYDPRHLEDDGMATIIAGTAASMEVNMLSRMALRTAGEATAPAMPALLTNAAWLTRIASTTVAAIPRPVNR